MKNIEVVKVGHIDFLKDCAKGKTLKEFKKTHCSPAFGGIDLDKAYIILGGKTSGKKEEIKKKKDTSSGNYNK